MSNFKAKFIDHDRHRNITEAKLRGQRLKRIRNLANLSRQEMCQDASINISTLKGWELGVHGGLTANGAEKVLGRVLKEGVICSKEWLMEGKGMSPQLNISKLEPVYHNIEQNVSEDQLITNELALFKQQFNHSIVIKIDDDGVSPPYEPGDFVAGIVSDPEQIKSNMGKVCIIVTQSGETLVRKIREDSEYNKYMLVCTNPDTQVKQPVLYNVECQKIAIIIRHYKSITNK